MIRSEGLNSFVTRIISGGFIALTIKVANAGIYYAMLVILARLLSPDEYGRFVFGISVATTLSVLPCLGLPVAVLRYWPEYNVKDLVEVARSFVMRSFTLIFLCSVGCAIIFFIVAVALTKQEDYGPYYIGSIAIMIALTGVSEFVASALRADGAIFSALAPRDVFWRLFIIAICGGLAYAGIELNAEIALQVAVVCLLAICLPQTIYAVRRLRVSLPDLKGPTRYADWLNITWPMWASSIVLFLIRQFDVVLLGLFESPEKTGYYFAALRTASLLTLMPMAGSMIAAPLFSQFFHANDQARLRHTCTVLILCIAMPTLIGFVFVVWQGKWLLSLFDPAFVEAYPLLIILSVGFTLASLAGPVTPFLQMVGHQREFLKIMAYVYAVVVVVQCLALPTFGEMGLAIPSAIGTCAMAFWAVILLRQKEGLDPSVLGLLMPATTPAK